MTRFERRRLREIERGVDPEWARVFEGSSKKDRRRRVAVRVVVDLAAIAVLVSGAVAVSMPTLFLGAVLANVAVCCHLA
ncbi:DUF3040 domain-containing protein [Amycolatopsis rhabdoformis]|uniref:DUF3040 domain-containing protein n=1 Tax=Amycolatopsis rhabdoformis TaxID=1448059 RepID=A0ABZ1I5D5_9PSEU|nr:DUF3040 domain-containing protein [Amycolatopsis rhabdoformis]WSE28703.1 DUF3040 domain-containing protein [Amycolatopsis rhabdoformis]